MPITKATDKENMEIMAQDQNMNGGVQQGHVSNTDDDFGQNFGTAFHNATAPYMMGAPDKTLPSGKPAGGLGSTLGSLAGTVVRDAPGAITGAVGGSFIPGLGTAAGAMYGAAASEGSGHVVKDVRDQRAAGKDTNPLNPQNALRYGVEAASPVAMTALPFMRGGGPLAVIGKNIIGQGAGNAAAGSAERGARGEKVDQGTVGQDFATGAAAGAAGGVAHSILPWAKQFFGNRTDQAIENATREQGVPGTQQAPTPDLPYLQQEDPLGPQYKADTAAVYNLLIHHPNAAATRAAVEHFTETYGESPIQAAERVHEQVKADVERQARGLLTGFQGNQPNSATGQPFSFDQSNVPYDMLGVDKAQRGVQEQAQNRIIQNHQMPEMPPANLMTPNAHNAAQDLPALQAQLDRANQANPPGHGQVNLQPAIEAFAQEHGMDPNEVYQWLIEKEQQMGLLSEVQQNMAGRNVAQQYGGGGAPQTPGADAAAQELGPMTDKARLQRAQRIQATGQQTGQASPGAPVETPYLDQMQHAAQYGDFSGAGQLTSQQEAALMHARIQESVGEGQAAGHRQQTGNLTDLERLRQTQGQGARPLPKTRRPE